MSERRDKPSKPYVGDYGAPIEGTGRVAAASLSLVVLACLVGFVVGVVVWGALSLSNLLIQLLWHDLPAALPFDAPWLPLVLCPFGGLIIGLWTRAFRNAPASLETVMGEVRATGGYRLRGLGSSIVSFLLPLVFGGSIGPEAGLPVMEGKCVLFKEFGGVDAFPICLNAKTKEEVIAAVKAIAPTFGGINLEDIRSPECFEIEAELERDLDIPVFHDDQHGTAIIVLAGVLNALKVVGKRIEDVKIVQNGPGAAGTAIIHMLQVAGAKNIVAVDEHGILYPNRPAGLEGHKGRLAEETNPDKLTGGLAEAIRDADIFIGTSIAGALTPELAATMAKDAIVFAMANPTPEIMPDLAKQAGVRVIGTGRSDFPNQVNNVLAFPGIFKGALSVRARDINPAMKMAAAKAIAGLIPDDELNEENILPKAFDPRVADAVAAAVAQAARESGVARV